MPEQKKTRRKREMAQTHAMVSAKPGFRVKGVCEIDRPKVTSHLKELETMGFVLFVPGVGWVDSTPAVRRFKEALGLTMNGLVLS
jgi:hypothetical protein